MKGIFEIDEKDRLPKPTAEALTIPQFRDIWKRQQKINGDHDGRKKVHNTRELSYIYFMTVYDSRFKLLSEKERIKGVKKLVELEETWEPDLLVLEGLKVFEDLQKTESTELAEVISTTVQNLTEFIRHGNATLKDKSISDSKEVAEFLSIVEEAPKKIEQLKQVREKLIHEQQDKARGRGGKKINLFEDPTT